MDILLFALIKGVLVAIIASTVGLEGLSFEWWCFIIALNILVNIP